MKSKVLLRWNFIGRTFLENAIPLSLAVFLQLRVVIFQKAYLIICIVMALISLISIFGFTLFFCKSLYQRDSEHLEKKLIRKMYGTFYEGIKLSAGVLSKYYNMLILFRGILITCLVTFLEAMPILQILPLILFNIVFVYYLFKQVKFRSRTFTIIIRLKEILILLAEVCVLCLCAQIKSEKYYQIFGYLIVLFFGIALLVEIIYILVLQICEIPLLWKKIKNTWNALVVFWKKMTTKSGENMNEKVKLKVQERPRNQITIVEQPSEIISFDNNTNQFQ